MAGNRHLARQAAVQALYQWDLTEQAPETILEHFIQEHDISEIDEEYFQLLVREVPLYHRELEAHIIPKLDRDLDDVDPVERAILRIGAYELEYRADVPRKACRRAQSRNLRRDSARRSRFPAGQCCR